MVGIDVSFGHKYKILSFSQVRSLQGPSSSLRGGGYCPEAEEHQARQSRLRGRGRALSE